MESFDFSVCFAMHVASYVCNHFAFHYHVIIFTNCGLAFSIISKVVRNDVHQLYEPHCD